MPIDKLNYVCDTFKELNVMEVYKLTYRLK